MISEAQHSTLLTDGLLVLHGAARFTTTESMYEFVHNLGRPHPQFYKIMEIRPKLGGLRLPHLEEPQKFSLTPIPA